MNSSNSCTAALLSKHDFCMLWIIQRSPRLLSYRNPLYLSNLRIDYLELSLKSKSKHINGKEKLVC